jgi:hypothetical protein
MQDYPLTEDVQVTDDTPVWPSRQMVRIIARDGLIVPILVRKTEQGYIAADAEQGERVLAALECNFETLLVETEW